MSYVNGVWGPPQAPKPPRRVSVPLPLSQLDELIFAPYQRDYQAEAQQVAAELASLGSDATAKQRTALLVRQANTAGKLTGAVAFRDALAATPAMETVVANPGDTLSSDTLTRLAHKVVFYQQANLQRKDLVAQSRALADTVRQLKDSDPTYEQQQFAATLARATLDGAFSASGYLWMRVFSSEQEVYRQTDTSSFTGLYVDFEGNQSWFQNGMLHRVGVPARIRRDGTVEYWQDNQRHRTDGPAVEWPDGTVEYWQDNQRHRTDGPALAKPGGLRKWYVHGELHRLGQPAVEKPDGTSEYWEYGQRVEHPKS